MFHNMTQSDFVTNVQIDNGDYQLFNHIRVDSPFSMDRFSYHYHAHL